MAMMSSSFITNTFSSPMVYSVAAYFPKITRSPFFTSGAILSPVLVRRPGPTATTSPCWGFSLAVSGMMMPPFFCSGSSIG
jgi:hypothetical protein